MPPRGRGHWGRLRWMIALRVLAFTIGALVVAPALGSAVRSFLVPRAIPSRIGRLVFVCVRRVFSLWAGPHASYERRDRVMAYYAPIALLSLLVTWLALVLVGYSAIYWALTAGTIRESAVLSGSSLFTLGFALD